MFTPNFSRLFLVPRTFPRLEGLAESETKVTVASALETYSLCYRLEELAVGPERLPFVVGPTRKEDHLSNDDFEKVFGMSRESFRDLKPWRQLEAKKRVSLF
uniref:HP domain-containing protein n=1 Tax=Steinernema glaseri TaxID=37863 RepID=A0A1I7ZIS2_9BILA